MLRYAAAPGLRLRLSSFQPLINHHILPPAMRINKNKMKKVIHYDGEQNLNKTNKWREWKQTVIAYYWLFGSSIWEAVAETTQGGFWSNITLQYKGKVDHTGYTLRHLLSYITATNNYILKHYTCVHYIKEWCQFRGRSLSPISFSSNIMFL